MHQFGATGIPPSRREADTRSPLDDDDEDLINPGSPNTFEDDISEDEVSLDARSSSPPPPTSAPPLPPVSLPPPGPPVSSAADLLHSAAPAGLPLPLDAKGQPRSPSASLPSPSKDAAPKDVSRASPELLKGEQDTSKSLLAEPPSLPSSLQALAPALTIASLVSSHKRPASPHEHYVTPIRPIPERHVFGYSSLQPMTKRPFTLSPIGPITDRHFLSSAGAFQPIRLQSKQKEET